MSVGDELAAGAAKSRRSYRRLTRQMYSARLIDPFEIHFGVSATDAHATHGIESL